MVSGSLDTVVVNRQSIPRGGYPHPPRIVNAITKQNHHLHQHQVQQQPQHSPFQLRFSDGPLRPWPPMYTANTVVGGTNTQGLTAVQYHGPQQYRSLIAKHNNNYQLYLNNLKNLYAYNTMKSSASSKYNKFMFNHMPHHPQSEQGFMLNAPPNGMMTPQGHLAAAAAAAAKSKEQHFMQSYFQSQKNLNHQYHKAGSQYSTKDQGGGSSMSESEQKQIRRMRTTQSMPPPNPCGCNNRSKSMEDIRDVVVDWTVSPKAPHSVINGVSPKQKLNNVVLNNGTANKYFMNNNHHNMNNIKVPETYGYNNNTRRLMSNAEYIINGQLANIKNKNNMRRSMDNLLDIEASYTHSYQVYN